VVVAIWAAPDKVRATAPLLVAEHPVGLRIRISHGLVVGGRPGAAPGDNGVQQPSQGR
jgi:hypothetical protein